MNGVQKLLVKEITRLFFQKTFLKKFKSTNGSYYLCSLDKQLYVDYKLFRGKLQTKKYSDYDFGGGLVWKKKFDVLY